MKKNLILFLIALALGVFTYFFQELGDRERHVQKLKEGQILDLEKLGELKGFSLPNVKLSKQGDRFFFPLSGALVDERRIEWFMKILSGVRVKRVLSKEEWQGEKREVFFNEDEMTMEFLFEGGSASFTLGKKLDFDRSFYMEVSQGGDERELVIAFDSGEHEAIYDRKEGHRSDHHYRRIASLFSLDQDFFRDYRLFRHWMASSWSIISIGFSESRNRDYSLNFPKASTIPSVPSLISVDKDALATLEREISILEAKAFYQKNKIFDLLPPLVEIKIESSKGKATLRLYPHPKENEEYLISSDLDGHTYRIDKEKARYLLAPLQRYWNLNILTGIPEQIQIGFSNTQYLVQLKREDGQFSTSLLRQEGAVKNEKLMPIHSSFKLLLDFLQRRATYWTEGRDVLDGAKRLFELSILGRSFVVMTRSGEIILYHQESQQSLIYQLEGKVPIKVLQSEYFYE